MLRRILQRFRLNRESFRLKLSRSELILSRYFELFCFSYSVFLKL